MSEIRDQRGRNEQQSSAPSPCCPRGVVDEISLAALWVSTAASSATSPTSAPATPAATSTTTKARAIDTSAGERAQKLIALKTGGVHCLAVGQRGLQLVEVHPQQRRATFLTVVVFWSDLVCACSANRVSTQEKPLSFFFYTFRQHHHEVAPIAVHFPLRRRIDIEHDRAIALWTADNAVTRK